MKQNGYYANVFSSSSSLVKLLLRGVKWKYFIYSKKHTDRIKKIYSILNSNGLNCPCGIKHAEIRQGNQYFLRPEIKLKNLFRAQMSGSGYQFITTTHACYYVTMQIHRLSKHPQR